MRKIIQDFLDEYLRYRITAEKAMAQVPDNALNRIVTPSGNSIAMLVRHISGNLTSRFTDFLTTDGEKPWRNRDSEFETREYQRSEVNDLWERGWAVLEKELGSVTDSDLGKTVRIRGRAWTVHEALTRSLAHSSYHVGEIVLLARMFSGAEWKWISIPKGMSKQYSQNPTLEKNHPRDAFHNSWARATLQNRICKI